MEWPEAGGALAPVSAGFAGLGRPEAGSRPAWPG